MVRLLVSVGEKRIQFSNQGSVLYGLNTPPVCAGGCPRWSIGQLASYTLQVASCKLSTTRLRFGRRI
jgi:hypothetical protein